MSNNDTAQPNRALLGNWSARAPDRRSARSSWTREFKEIYEDWFEEVAKWVRAIGGPDADRQDLTQEVFVVAYQHLHQFDGRNLRGWLYQIARHRVRDFRRLRWSRLLLDKVPLSESIPSTVVDPEAQLLGKEREQLLRRLLAKLPESQRIALVMFEIEGYSGEEIARLQGIPVNTVWARLHKARKKLNAQPEQLSTQRPLEL